MAVGSDKTRLVVLRGNSGSGKSTVANAVRAAYGSGMAWVSQDPSAGSFSRKRTGPAE